MTNVRITEKDTTNELRKHPIHGNVELNMMNNLVDFSIVFSNASAKWLHSQTNNSLDSINLTIKSCQLTAIVGRVGAGKVLYKTNVLEMLLIRYEY